MGRTGAWFAEGVAAEEALKGMQDDSRLPDVYARGTEYEEPPSVTLPLAPLVVGGIAIVTIVLIAAGVI